MNFNKAHEIAYRTIIKAIRGILEITCKSENKKRKNLVSWIKKRTEADY